MAVQNSSLIGANLGGASDGATALFSVGSRAQGSDNTQWVYVYANQALTTGHCLNINSTFTAVLASPTAMQTLAFAQGVFAAADFGWVALKGDPIYVLISSVSTVAGALALTADNTGILTAGTVSGTIAGIFTIQVTATSAQTARQAFVDYPRSVSNGTSSRG